MRFERHSPYTLHAAIGAVSDTKIVCAQAEALRSDASLFGFFMINWDHSGNRVIRCLPAETVNLILQVIQLPFYLLYA
jgi:hypothetical protein